MEEVFGNRNEVSPSASNTSFGQGGCAEGDNAVAAYLDSEFGLREWCFRSSTGFTALGLTVKAEHLNQRSDNCKIQTSPNICGILFPIDSSGMLDSFDSRERGYNRVKVPLHLISLNLSVGCLAAQQRAICLRRKFDEAPNDITIWVYVPDKEHYFSPSEDYPILQTYIDVCIRGCLQWGGIPYALEFLQSTIGWSEFYLNDAPMSRRPWLHRPDYSIIDSCLEKVATHVRLSERRHPEEYSSFHLTALRGMWGVPSRNHVFIGRGDVIHLLHNILSDDHTKESTMSPVLPSKNILETNAIPNRTKGILESNERDMSSPYDDSLSENKQYYNIRHAEITGLGGVGKTQLAAEYVHRHFGNYYGLVAWLRAESSVTIAADMRRLAFDLGILKSNMSMMKDNQNSINNSNTNATIDKVECNEKVNDIDMTSSESDVDDEVVVEEVKRRLSRCKCRWLLVFDNVEDPSIVASYLPRGLGLGVGLSMTSTAPHSNAVRRWDSLGHVLVTSRVMACQLPSTIVLDSFQPPESLRYLQVALGVEEIISYTHQTNPVTVGNGFHGMCQHSRSSECEYLMILAERMGHLPLALAMAAAYMTRCDLTAAEYLTRLDSLILGANAKNRGEEQSTSLAGDSVFSSLSMTVDRIGKESQAAASVLPSLGFLSSDNITKRLVRHLIVTSYFKTRGPQAVTYTVRLARSLYPWSLVLALIGLVAVMSYTFIHSMNGNTYLIASSVCFSLLATVAFFRTEMQLKLCAVVNYIFVHFDNIIHIHSKDSYSNTASDKDDEVLAGETDRVWELLRHFSLLTMRGSRLKRIGSIHRLQQSVLRARCARAEETLCIERCIWAISKLWHFNQSDTYSWDSCSDHLEHVQALTRYTLELMAYENKKANGNGWKNQCSMRWKYALKLAKLLTEAGSYSVVALSRFDSAQQLLDSAASIHHHLAEIAKTKRSNIWSYFSIQEPSLTQQHKLEIDRATTLHHLGKVLRYNGRLEDSWTALTGALQMRKKLSPQSAMVADTLHELGVLNLKRHELSLAEHQLQLSLVIKRQIKSTSSGKYSQGLGSEKYFTNTQKSFFPFQFTTKQKSAIESLETTEAATLHQLAIVATAKKQYDVAERLLHEALALEESHDTRQRGDGVEPATRPFISRAATLQQLGRVALRRGLLDEAKGRLSEALELYKKAYGERRASVHVNVAAVHHQLVTYIYYLPTVHSIVTLSNISYK